jgi:hypothetical protein
VPQPPIIQVNLFGLMVTSADGLVACGIAVSAGLTAPVVGLSPVAGLSPDDGAEVPQATPANNIMANAGINQCQGLT